VVFRDAGLDFADQVCAYVGGLGLDSPADSSEKCDAAGSEAEPGHLLQGVFLYCVACFQLLDQHDEAQTQAEKPESNYSQSHDCAAFEGNLQAFVERLGAGLGGEHVGGGSDQHADLACTAREERAEQEADCGLESGQLVAVLNQHNRDDHKADRHEVADLLVLFV